MNLSRKSDYALRAVQFLAAPPKGKIGSINTIAREKSLPREFLAKILKDLTVAGILTSFKGVTGGYRLARPSGKISFLDVIEAVDGPLHLCLCTETKKCSCHKGDHCNMHQFWVTQEKSIRNTLSKRTFNR